ncbi:MAG: dienelactone hydrolase family protein [Pseudomonadota bacterium]|nr:dienelactone hydrolase family protein [Pseudomonadota bacterium]
MNETRVIGQGFAGAQLRHELFHDGSGDARPGVILFPTVMGVTDLERGFAGRLVGLGYSALIADLYGRRFAPAERDEAMAAMTALREDRAGLRERLLAVLGAAQEQEEIDDQRVAAIGFCFGGQNALDLARSGAEVAGVASFHGLFDPPGLPPRPIPAKVAAYHGWDDPLVPPEAVVALAEELTEAGCDWQISAFGHVGHGFTNPGATGAMPGIKYDERSARRAWAACDCFLAECFE